MSAEEVDAYLAALPRADQRKALADLRARLKALLPDHPEVISYAMPGFRQPGPRGRMVAGYAAFARHMGLYPHSGSVIPALGPGAEDWKCSKSGILFTAATLIPDALLARIIDLRQQEIALMGR